MVLNTGEAGAMTTTRMLETAEAEVAYDVRGPLPTTDGRPPLFMIGQPMNASGFVTLASYFPDRTVVTYDPRGLGRRSRNSAHVDDGRTHTAAAPNTVWAVDFQLVATTDGRPVKVASIVDGHTRECVGGLVTVINRRPEWILGQPVRRRFRSRWRGSAGPGA